MDEYVVVGVTDGSYTGKDGRFHKGLRFFLQGTKALVSRDAAEYASEGYSTSNIWIANGVVSEAGFIPSVGDKISLFYNRYGSVSGYKPV